MLDLAKSKINFDKSLTFYLHVLKGKPACRFESFRFWLVKMYSVLSSHKNCPKLFSLTQKKKKKSYINHNTQTLSCWALEEKMNSESPHERNFEEVIKGVKQHWIHRKCKTKYADRSGIT